MSKQHVRFNYLVQIGVVILWTISLLVSDPLNHRGKNMQRQGLVPTTIWLTRLKDPLKQKVVWSDLEKTVTEPSMPTFTRLEVSNEIEYDSSVYNFLVDHTFTEDDDFKTFAEISKNYISPHTRAMVLMGCYGDPLHNEWMKSPELQKMARNASTAFMLNIILQTWEDAYNPFYEKQATLQSLASGSGHVQNDRSACSCMKDFANPALLKSGVEVGETKYSYDSCLMQNVVDYTAKTGTRQRLDPMTIELQAYVALVSLYYKDANGTSTWANVSMSTAIKDHPEIALLHSIIDKTSLPKVLILKEFMDALGSHIQAMYPHNKLRTPKAREEGDSDNLLAQNPPSVSVGSFALYMQKYRSAFQVCAYNGVPQYQTKQLVLLVATKFSKLGFAFLLGAVMIGFSALYQKLKQSSSDTYPQTERGLKILEFITRVLIVVTLVLSLSSISQDLGDEKYALEKQTMLAFTTAVWWVFALVLAFNFGYDTYKTMSTEEDQTYVLKQISQDVCIIGGLANLGVSFLLHRGESDEYVVTACFVLFLTIGLIQHISNLVRMMQLYTASIPGDKSASDSGGNTTYKIAYNRVLVLLLVALGLLGYVMLASSSVQTWTLDVLYGYQRVRIFAICAFLIFSTFDIFFEVLVVMKFGSAAEFKEQHPRKMMWTAWVIIVSLLILQMHQYSALCMSRDPKAPEDVCNLLNYFFQRTMDWNAVP